MPRSPASPVPAASRAATWTLRALTLLVVFGGAVISESPAHADEVDEQTAPAALFKGAIDALSAERPNEAIAKLEALGDRGIVDAVVSYDRGLAYAARVRAGAEQPGDLGRAAHGFEESRELTSDKHLFADATNALAAVRSEIARRRSRAGDPVEIAHGFSLGRSIVELLPENAWAIFGLVMALALSVALVARRFVNAGRARVAATTTAAITGSFLVISAVLSWAARDARLHLREGIVVTPNARLLNANHLVIDSVSPLPEGIRTRIIEEDGGYSRVTLSGTDGYLPSSAILPLAKR